LDVFSYAERPLSQPLSVPLSFVSGAHIRDNIAIILSRRPFQADEGCDKGPESELLGKALAYPVLAWAVRVVVVIRS
jgi:hypothetical protein